jgi:hypothetical protein
MEEEVRIKDLNIGIESIVVVQIEITMTIDKLSARFFTLRS